MAQTSDEQTSERPALPAVPDRPTSDEAASTASASRRPGRFIVAAVAAAVPLAVIAAVVLGGGSDPEPRTEPQAQAGDAPAAEDEAAADEGAAGEGDAAAGDGAAAPEGAGEEAAATPPPSAAQVEAEPEIPSAPGAAGTEGDRPVVTYPRPEVPDGGCEGAEGTAVVDLTDKPSPVCIQVGADQALVFRNGTGEEISVVAEGLNEVVPAGGELTVGRVADAFPEGRSTFWSPGNPELSGYVEVS